jgi:Na+/melibiose symporter-like transporter
VIVMIGYMLFHCSMNFNQTARSSLIPKLAGADMEARKRLTARQSQVGAAVSIISSAITLPLVQFIEKVTGSPSAGYFLAALIFSSIFVVCNINFIRLATPFDPPEDANSVSARKRPTVAQMVDSVVNNKMMLILFLGYTLTGLGTQLNSGVITYWFRVTGNFSKYTYVLTARSICAFLASMVAPKIGRKLGKKGALCATWGISAILSLATKLFAFTNGEPRLMVMAVIMCLRQASGYLSMIFMANYWLDCGEYGYYQTGVETGPWLSRS